MRRCCFVLLLMLVASNILFAESAADRAQSAADVLSEIMAAPDKGIPEEVMGSAKCIAVIPSLVKGGLVWGGAHGRGMATCRTDKGWSAPAPLSLTGGSFGLQIGLQGVDVVMLVMNERGMQALLASQFKVGGDASAAAGPVGRHAEASTDWKMKAEVLTYSRARGLFAGLTLNGSVIKQDDDATRELYGRVVPFRSLLTGGEPTPKAAQPFVAAVQKAAPQIVITPPAAPSSSPDNKPHTETPEGKSSDAKPSDQQSTDQTAGDQKTNDQKATDQKPTDQKKDPKAPDPKNPDQKTPDPKTPDPKSPDPTLL
jgi:lipid-binding SYLF domain-containing protein